MLVLKAFSLIAVSGLYSGDSSSCLFKNDFSTIRLPSGQISCSIGSPSSNSEHFIFIHFLLPHMYNIKTVLFAAK